MRTITIPAEWLAKAADPSIPGRVVEGVVAVDWPELRLTEAQIIANALASANGQPPPYEDHSLIAIQIPRLAL